MILGGNEFTYNKDCEKFEKKCGYCTETSFACRKEKCPLEKVKT